MTIEEKHINELHSGTELPDDKKYYFNGFVVSMSPSDFTFVIQNNKIPLANINASHSVMKSFAKTIMEIIEGYEKDSGLEISSLEEIDKRIKDKRE